MLINYLYGSQWRRLQWVPPQLEYLIRRSTQFLNNCLYNAINVFLEIIYNITFLKIIICALLYARIKVFQDLVLKIGILLIAKTIMDNL